MSRTGSVHPHSLGCEGLQCSNALAWCFLSSSHSTGEATSAPPTPLLLLCAQEGSAGLRQDKTLDKQSSEHGFLCTLAQLSSDSPHPSPHEDTGSIHKARRDVPLKAVQHPNSHQTTGSSRHYGGQKAEYGDESSSDAVKVHVCTRGVYSPPATSAASGPTQHSLSAAHCHAGSGIADASQHLQS